MSLLTVCVVALIAMLAGSSEASASSTSNPFEGRGPLSAQIISGQESSISQFPWQVYILVVNEHEGTESSCGGSILGATTILTAAHCVDHERTTSPYAEGEVQIRVFAGASSGLGFRGHLEPSPSTYQERLVKSIRRDPYYAVAPEIKDDAALLTLETPLELSPARNAEAIGLVAVGSTPASGTPLSVSGYGKQEGAEGEAHNANGKLYSTNLTAISSDACRAAVGVNSAVLLCAGSPSSSTCQGDSGGPLTEGNPAVEVGTVDFGAKECPVGVPDVFTNLAAPEVRDFIEGSETPPVAARVSSAPIIKSVGPVPVNLSPLTCEPGAWSGSPTFSYSFQVETPSATVLQSEPGNIFTSPSSLVGAPLVCVVEASNPGGVSTARSPTTAAIATDTAAPMSSITALKCVAQACTLSITASDPNAVSLTLVPSSSYLVTTKCPVKKKSKKKKKTTNTKKPAKPPVCHRTQTVPMSLVNLSAGSYAASVSRLPYGENITFDVVASNAAGLTQLAPSVAVTTLHKPTPKKKLTKKSKRKTRRR